MTTQLVLAVILVVSAIIILLGVGDFLIAGYNTASKTEKEQVNIKRLRLIIGLLLLLIAPALFMLGDNILLDFLFIAIVLGLAVIAIKLANTWAKKK